MAQKLLKPHFTKEPEYQTKSNKPKQSSKKPTLHEPYEANHSISATRQLQIFQEDPLMTSKESIKTSTFQSVLMHKSENSYF